MTPIPVVCDECGRPFVTESFIHIEGGGSAAVTMLGVGGDRHIQAPCAVALIITSQDFYCRGGREIGT